MFCIYRSIDKIDSTHIRPVNQIIMHPAFNLTGRLNFNAAILVLEHSIKLDWVKAPIILESDDHTVDKLNLIAWAEFRKLERPIELKDIHVCANKMGKNMSGSEYGCLQLKPNPVQPFCLTGCPVMHNDTLFGICTSTAKKLTKNDLQLMTNAPKLKPFIHAVLKGVDFDKWKEDVEDLVKEFVKDVVRKSFI